MAQTPVAVVDYGAGNLTSVACAIRHLGWQPLVTRDPSDVRSASRVVFPGVGAARASMENLRELGLADALRQVFERGRPILGICIGCQVIFESSSEDGGTRCLGLLKGSVTRFEFPAGVVRKIPHMGWNEVRFSKEHPVFKDVREGSQFYFVHSYYPCPADVAIVKGTASYGGIRFAAAVASENLAAVQFHTEKSGPPGLQILRNFLEWDPERG
jgi:glutamine amidotransferase